jgi:hypothetical protein
MGIFSRLRRPPLGSDIPTDLVRPDPAKRFKGARPLQNSPLNPKYGPRKPKPPETSPRP